MNAADFNAGVAAALRLVDEAIKAADNDIEYAPVRNQTTGAVGSLRGLRWKVKELLVPEEEVQDAS
jgi:hypothetical protein